MMEEIAVENDRISNFEGLVTLTLDWVILHTVMHRSSTSTYAPNFIEIEETFCRRTDTCAYVRTYVRTDGRTDRLLRPALYIGLTLKSKKLCGWTDVSTDGRTLS